MKWLENIKRGYRILIFVLLFLSFVFHISLSENIIISIILLGLLIIYGIPFCYVENKLSKQEEAHYHKETPQEKNELVVWFEGLSSKVRLGICFVLLGIFLFYIIVFEVDFIGFILAVIAGFYLFYAIYVEEKLARRKAAENYANYLNQKNARHKQYEKNIEDKRLQERADQEKKKYTGDFNFNVSISSGATYSRDLEFPIYTKARGVTFEGRQEYLADSSVADDLIIEHCPTKKYPERMVIINESIDEQIGNVSAELATALVEEYGEGCKFYGMIADITGGEDGRYLGCNFSIDGIEYD